MALLLSKAPVMCSQHQGFMEGRQPLHVCGCVRFQSRPVHFTLDLHAGFVQEADRVAPARPVIPDEMLAALKEEVKMCAG